MQKNVWYAVNNRGPTPNERRKLAPRIRTSRGVAVLTRPTSHFYEYFNRSDIREGKRGEMAVLLCDRRKIHPYTQSTSKISRIVSQSGTTCRRTSNSSSCHTPVFAQWLTTFFIWIVELQRIVNLFNRVLDILRILTERNGCFFGLFNTQSPILRYLYAATHRLSD